MKTMRNKITGNEEQIPQGFSFTTLFFGILVPLLRGDYMGAVIMLLCAIFSGGLSWIVFPFIYNSMYEKYLIKQGYSSV